MAFPHRFASRPQARTLSLPGVHVRGCTASTARQHRQGCTNKPSHSHCPCSSHLFPLRQLLVCCLAAGSCWLDIQALLAPACVHNLVNEDLHTPRCQFINTVGCGCCLARFAGIESEQAVGSVARTADGAYTPTSHAATVLLSTGCLLCMSGSTRPHPPACLAASNCTATVQVCYAASLASASHLPRHSPAQRT